MPATICARAMPRRQLTRALLTVWGVVPAWRAASAGLNPSTRGRFRKRNLKHAKECSIQQRRGFACGVCRWKRRFGCSRNSAVSAARFESGFRERDGQGQHWRGPHSHGGFLKMIVCESGGHANGLTCFIFRFLRRPPFPHRREPRQLDLHKAQRHDRGDERGAERPGLEATRRRSKRAHNPDKPVGEPAEFGKNRTLSHSRRFVIM